MFICGSTRIIEHVSPGVVVKQPIRLEDQYEAARIANCFSVELRILERTGVTICSKPSFISEERD